MEILEIYSTSFPDAHELPNRNWRPAAGRNKSASANGTRQKKAMVVPPALAAHRKASQEATAANKKMLVIGPTGKRRWVLLRDVAA